MKRLSQNPANRKQSGSDKNPNSKYLLEGKELQKSLESFSGIWNRKEAISLLFFLQLQRCTSPFFASWQLARSLFSMPGAFWSSLGEKARSSGLLCFSLEEEWLQIQIFFAEERASAKMPASQTKSKATKTKSCKPAVIRATFPVLSKNPEFVHRFLEDFPIPKSLGRNPWKGRHPK